MTSQRLVNDANRKREQRRSDKVIFIPACEDRKRRDELEQDDEAWLLHYFGRDCGCADPFWYSFTEHQRDMIHAIKNAMVNGGDQAIAAPRGEGKTTLAERLLTKYTLQGTLSFSVLFAATGSLAETSLDAIKTAVEENELLAADYPEVCIPVQSLEGAPQRAPTQVASGARHDDGTPYEMARTKFSWCGTELIFPRVPGSPSSGAIIATRGLDAAVRGLKKRGRRPQLAIIDDPDTEETARSESQAQKLETRIDRAIAGLGSQQKRIGRVMLTTLQSRIAVSYRFTDRKQKPLWKGNRFRFMVAPPERVDLWDEYIQLFQRDCDDGDEFGRTAHSFLIERFDDMHAGAVVGNPHRFDASILPDGTQKELSPVQHYYNQVAATSAEAVATEYDNDPPEEDGPLDNGLTASVIQSRLSGLPRGEIATDVACVVQGIDVQKAGLHWVVKAFRSDGTCWVIDYGFHETYGTTYGSKTGVELAVRRAALSRMEEVAATTYGEHLKLTLIDSGWQADAIYAACSEIGAGIYPAKGHGKSQGCASLNFTPHTKRDMDTRPGDGWYMKRQPKESRRVWLVHCDTDRWKAFEHARWLTQEGKPGAAYIYGVVTDEERKYLHRRMALDSKEHHGFSRHITAESEVEDVVRGVLKRMWRIKPGRVQNHYLDASYLCNVASSMLGVRLFGSVASVLKENVPRPTAAQLAGRQ